MKAWNRGRCWPTGNIWTPGHRSSGSSNYARDSKFNPVACSFLHSGPQLRLFWSWTRTTGSSALDCAIREHSLLCSAASDAADNVEGKVRKFPFDHDTSFGSRDCNVHELLEWDKQKQFENPSIPDQQWQSKTQRHRGDNGDDGDAMWGFDLGQRKRAVARIRLCPSQLCYIRKQMWCRVSQRRFSFASMSFVNMERSSTTTTVSSGISRVPFSRHSTLLWR